MGPSGGYAAGVGVAGRHHGEILQGAVRRDGELVPCLITMSVGGIGSTARYISAETPGLEVVPPWKSKAQRAAGLALASIGAPVVGRLEIECTVATGVGLGSSTSDVVAAIRAVCAFYGASLDAREVARLAIEAEGASDPLMFDGEVVLFAQRHGCVLESFGRWVPRYTLLSIDTDERGDGVDTLSLPPRDYSDAELSSIEAMVGRARRAFAERDGSAIAAIATESAALNQRFLPLRHFREIRQLASEHRALGVQISHSGTVAGILFDESRGADAAHLLAHARSLGLTALLLPPSIAAQMVPSMD